MRDENNNEIMFRRFTLEKTENTETFFESHDFVVLSREVSILV